MIKAVLFDFDGVLTTDATGSESICKYISQKTGLDYDFLLSAYRKYNKDLLYGKYAHSDMWEDFCEQINMPIGKDILYDSFINTPIDHDMVDVVENLKRHKYKTGMITDNKSDRIESIVAHHNWDKLFDVIAISANVGSGKDDKAIFLDALSGLGLEAGECVFVDNNHKNLVVPAGMGMRVIYFDDKERNIPMFKSALDDNGINI